MEQSTRRIEQDLRRQIREREARKKKRLSSSKYYARASRKVENRLKRFGGEIQRRTVRHVERDDKLRALDSRLAQFAADSKQAKADSFVSRYKNGSSIFEGTGATADRFLLEHNDLAREPKEWSRASDLWQHSAELIEDEGTLTPRTSDSSVVQHINTRIDRKMKEIRSMDHEHDRYLQAIGNAKQKVILKRQAEDAAAKAAAELSAPAAQTYTQEAREGLLADLARHRKLAAKAAAAADFAESQAQQAKGRFLAFGFTSPANARTHRLERRAELDRVLGLPAVARHRPLEIPKDVGTAYVDLSKQVDAQQKRMFRTLMNELGGSRPNAGSITLPDSDETKSMSFDELVGVGNLLKTKDVLDVREYKQKIHDEALEEKAREFDRRHALVSQNLARLENDSAAPDHQASNSAAVVPAAGTADPLLARNIVKQTPVSDAHLNARVYNLNPETAPVS